MKAVSSFHVAAPLECVARALCSETFNVQVQQAREDVVSSCFVPVEQSTDRVVFEMHSREFRRTKLGRMDRSATVPSISRTVWDASESSLHWKYSGPQGDRVDLGGTYRLRRSARGTDVEHEVSIEVRVPVVGGQIARWIAREFERSFPQYEAVLRRCAVSNVCSDGELPLPDIL